MPHRILIVGTVPYDKASTSRAFASYFTGMEKECLAQIFSDPHDPLRGHCGTLYQITDASLLKRRLNRSVEVGKIWRYEDLDESRKPAEASGRRRLSDAFISMLYRLGTKKNALNHLLRKLLWKHALWHTPKLDRWLESFSPDCVFLSFSDDFFIPEIAHYAAEKFDIPIVSSIGDDYFFNDRFSLSPLYHLYRSSYKRLIRNVFRHSGSAIYISDKIRDKYNSSFGLDGETVYLNSELRRRPFVPCAADHPRVCYYGNIGLGRDRSLCELSEALAKISPGSVVQVYSSQQDRRAIRAFQRCQSIRFCGSIPYSEISGRIREDDVFLIVEGFRASDIRDTRYSLSTKAADALASGSNLFVYGSAECGVVEYMKQTGAAAVCTEPSELEAALRRFLSDQAAQKARWLRAVEVTKQNHNLETSTRIFRGVVEKAIKRNGKQNTSSPL